MVNDPKKPFNELPLLPPAEDLESKRTLKRAIAANTALAELRGVGNLIPNQAVLLRSIVLQEARFSSEVENIVTTNDELYRALSEEQSSDPATKEVIRYGDALWVGYEHLAEGGMVSTPLVIRLASILTGRDLGVRRLPGTRIGNPRTGEVVYTPPEGEKLLLDLLENFLNYFHDKTEVDPLVQMAVLHYQFEAIHPFPDGNGRTGRILNVLFLIHKRLLELPVLYLSGYIIEHKKDYYRLLRAVTEQKCWEDWICFLLEGIEESAIQARRMVEQISQALESSVALAREQMPRGYSRELIEVVYTQPYTRIRHLELAGIAKRQTASEYLYELVRLGILEAVKSGRDVMFLNPRLLTILSGRTYEAV
ncbi:MAG: Fic family protein [Armatimonadetes bacterium]|nr:Fic family protein [Armatimonadota bacterium]